MPATTATRRPTSAEVRAERATRPACRACGRRGASTATTATGAVIDTCPWCEHQHISLPAPSAAPVAVAPEPDVAPCEDCAAPVGEACSASCMSLNEPERLDDGGLFAPDGVLF